MRFPITCYLRGHFSEDSTWTCESRTLKLQHAEMEVLSYGREDSTLRFRASASQDHPSLDTDWEVLALTGQELETHVRDSQGWKRTPW